MLTYKFRIKDSNVRNKLSKLSGSVNFVWNYANATSMLAWKRDRRWLSGFDMCNLTATTSKEIGLHSQTIKLIAQEHFIRRRKTKRSKLKWRSGKKNLGWIPFTASGVKVVDAKVRYCGHWYNFWKSRNLPDKIRTGCFVQDARKRWYVCFVCTAPAVVQTTTGTSIGIDLGFKTQVTCSDGIKYERKNLTREYEKKLAIAQKAKQKKRIKNIHSKIKNKRLDFNHKASTEIVKRHELIKIGNISPKKMIARKKGWAKSTIDSSWFQFKEMLRYKASRHGVFFSEVNEYRSTVICSCCGSRTGPSGLNALGVRAWQCAKCGTLHDRDVNAARNILNA